MAKHKRVGGDASSGPGHGLLFPPLCGGGRFGKEEHRVPSDVDSFFKKKLFIFRERGREGERERERNADLHTHTLTRDLTHNLGMCPDLELNL